MSDISKRARYWAEETKTWSGVLRRPFLSVGIAGGISVVVTFVAVALGPVVYQSCGWTIALLVAVCVLTGLIFCLCRAWRPAVSAASGAVAVGFAWFATEMASYATEASARLTFDMMCGALAFAFFYVTVFRPMGEQTKQEQDEAMMRRIIREELHSLDSTVERNG